jgi:hypothetical protein
MKPLPFFLSLTLLTAALVVMPAAAQASDFLATVCGFLVEVRQWLTRMVYVMGAIGMVFIAVKAYAGSFVWSDFLSIGGALFLVSFTWPVMQFLTSGNMQWDYCPGVVYIAV